MNFQETNSLLNRLIGNNVRMNLDNATITSMNIKKNAENFINKESGDEYLTTLFRTSLKKQLEQKVDNISELSDQEVRSLMPFVFSPKQVPDAFKALTVAATLSIPAEQVDLTKIGIEAADNMCDSIVRKSVQNGDSKLNEIVLKYRRSALDTGFFTNDSKLIVLDLLQKVLTKLKIYGEIIINGLYLEKYGEKEFENGKYFYNIIEIPYLQFEFNKSKVLVYEKKGGIRTIVKEKDFTYNYLKGLLKGIEIIKNTGVMKSFNNYLLPQQQKVDLANFRNNYLKNNDNN